MNNFAFPSLTSLSHALDAGSTTSVQLTQQALARANSGEGPQVYTQVFDEQALAAAAAADALRQAGVRRSAVDGLPISVKDLFDIKGRPTRAGSVILNDAPAALDNARVVQRLINAGAIIIGTTNMTEFAYSGLGVNPHYGTPRNPWERTIGEGRIPGGSSSGAAVSVTDAMAVAAIGSDTGGSVRIPSALCGLTGFKPTARRIPKEGILPLSSTLDSIGPLAASVECCAILDALMTGEHYTPIAPKPLESLRLLFPSNAVLDGADDHVAASYAHALSLLSAAGVSIVEQAVPPFDQLPDINAQGGFIAAEAWAWHRQLIADKADAYDPRVVSRMLRGKQISAADYIDLLHRREEWIQQLQTQLADFDAMIMPTVPVIAPTIAELRDEEVYHKTNLLLLRNPTFINFLDGCALSLPCHAPGTAPVGVSIAAAGGQDRTVLAIAKAVETLLQR
ncbi:amidase [Advenella sp. S44]|uniref:amidase n=1 Tax=Advenella sp. S44 TaxID=1982755 RepID=UPI000C2A1AA5|nr:amidase [Advenella sp. S44]PJX21141.1 amidase [Advenella sp. S44]